MKDIDKVEREYTEARSSRSAGLEFEFMAETVPMLISEVRRLREENEKLGRALDNNIKCSEKTDTELFQANLKMAEMSIEMKRLREENETLLCSCGELEEESKHWRKDAQNLFAENERLREENRELRNNYVEIGAMMEAIDGVLKGEEPNDFMLSFPLVRGTYDLLCQVELLQEELKLAREEITIDHKEMKAVDNFLGVNWSNDMRWSDEIIIAVQNRGEAKKMKRCVCGHYHCPMCGNTMLIEEE